MVQKLKSVLKDKRLISGLRALVFALAFVLLPKWIAIVIAVLFYLFPPSSLKKYAGIFAVFVFLCALFSGILPSWVFMIIFGALAVLFFGVKNNVFSAKSLSFLGFSSGLLMLLSQGYIYNEISLPIFAIFLTLSLVGLLDRFVPESRRNLVLPLSLSLAFGLSEIAWIFSFSGLAQGYALLSFSLLSFSGLTACLLEARFGKIAPLYAFFISSILVLSSALILILMVR